MGLRSMIAFPNCKINLGLNIIRKRDDGFHDLETVFFPIPFNDVLEIVRSEDQTAFGVTGIDVPAENNLCVKAYELLKGDFPELPAVRMHLHKAIPLGSGLGGGSADAAFTLTLLNEKFRLDLNKADLVKYALQLGSDCPFFLINKPCFATGRGELLEEIKVDLSPYYILLVNPGIHVSTAWAFSNLKPTQPVTFIKEIIAQPVETWKEKLVNDFEVPVFNDYPEIKKIKEEMYENGAVYASMSGSGSTVFGIFNNEPEILKKEPSYFYRSFKL